ncbi:Gag protein [Phytophthora palmivora]|uniref:Gag protein n=1 Tax=Phytophthora palmivora TaxID=4796 RepID=A0A2P4X599_9STRA|nr:Gag protein [Phytophthora palmivora]
MWTSFEQDKTKRDFANSIRVRAKLYGARFEKGRNMDRYLEVLKDYRRQLENMNTAISDNEMTGEFSKSMACVSSTFKQEWMLDTGTIVHVCTDLSAFRYGVQQDNEYFDDWQGSRSTSDGFGLVRVKTLNDLDPNGKNVLLDLHESRYSSCGHTNLVSQERLEQDGWVPSIPPSRRPEERITYFSNERYPGVQLVFKKRRGHYWLDATPVVSTNSICAASPSPNQDKLLVWHMRLGHLNVQAIKKMVELDMVTCMDTLTLADFKKPFRCIACQRAKQKRMAYKRQQEKRRKECYARLMSDVCHVGILTPGGNIYFQLIQDEASRLKWIFLLKDKAEAPQNVIDLILKLEKEHAIKIFSCDQGKEFVNKKLTSFLTSHGIELLTTNAYTPEENCLV